MFRNPETRRIAKVFDYADAGLFTLPEPVLRLREQWHRLTDHELPATSTSSAAEVAAAEFRSAAATGDGWPDVDELLALDARNTMLSHLARVRAETLVDIESSMFSAVAGRADEIITGHVRSVFDRLLVDLRAAVETLDGRPLTGAEILTAPKPIRDAAVAIDDLTTCYAQLRDVQMALAAVSQPSTDDGLYFEMRNPTDFRANRMSAPPWPTDDAVEMLRWMLAHGCDLWMPTPAERDELVESRVEAAA